MKTNPEKYHLLINNIKKSFQIKIGNETLTANMVIWNGHIYEYGLIFIWKIVGG